MRSHYIVKQVFFDRRLKGQAAGAQAPGLKAADFLDRNDTYTFFKPLGDLVTPGPTFTNVNDLRAILVS